MTDAMDYLANAMEEVEELISENRRLKRRLDAMSATEDEISRAEAIVALRKDVALWRGRYEFALKVMKEGDKAIVEGTN